MQYVMLIHHGTTPVPGDPSWESVPDERKAAIYAGWQALNALPGVSPGYGMEAPDSATVVRVRDGETLVTDGPFAEFKEAIGGMFLVEAEDLDGAIAVAAQVPSAGIEGAVEIRPIKVW
jgi:hypothetical protein